AQAELAFIALAGLQRPRPARDGALEVLGMDQRFPAPALQLPGGEAGVFEEAAVEKVGRAVRAGRPDDERNRLRDHPVERAPIVGQGGLGMLRLGQGFAPAWGTGFAPGTTIIHPAWTRSPASRTSRPRNSPSTRRVSTRLLRSIR